MLGNFNYCNPTKLYFGEEAIKNLSDELKNYGKRILLVYGGGSIKKNGIYDEVISILNEEGKEVTELSGVMSNPTLDKLYEGVNLARENNIDFILAVGGGSVVDYSKALSASIHCTEDPWQKFYIKMEDPDNEIVPLGDILTMVGTGSEMNGGAVITNAKEKLKIGKVFNEKVFPKFSILNPKVTFSIPKYQMVAGFFDIMSHILEQYFSNTDDNTSDYVMEGLLKSLIHSSLVAVENPEDYEARSNIMWIATWALNTFVAKGKSTDWMVHMIGQQVGAYTNATHGMTLSAVSIPYYRYIMKDGVEKFKRYAVNVWNVNPAGKTDEVIAKEGLDAMEQYMNKIGVVMKISELGVKEDMISDIAKSSFILPGGYRVLTTDEIEIILKKSM
jgi:alcohol dehydrogenase YqhD (iron-dependent ADH family)